ncbi:MAG: hypothetical protein WEB07_01605 [Natronospirillum sp.]
METIVQRLAIFFLPALLLLLPAVAQANDELTEGVIDRWADSMVELEAWGEENEHLTEEDFIDPEDPLNIEASMARTAREYPEVQALLADNGFSDGEHWAHIGGRIINAYGAMMLSATVASPDDVEAQMQAQLDVFADDPNITEQQLAMIRQQMEEATQMMSQMLQAPENDIAAVEASRGRLDQLFDN